RAVVAGLDLGARQQDQRLVLVLAADLLQLADRDLVVAGHQLVPPGGEVGASGTTGCRDNEQRKPPVHPSNLCAETMAVKPQSTGPTVLWLLRGRGLQGTRSELAGHLQLVRRVPQAGDPRVLRPQLVDPEGQLHRAADGLGPDLPRTRQGL